MMKEKARNLLAQLNTNQRGQSITRFVVHFILRGSSMDDAIQETKQLTYQRPELFTDDWVSAHATLSHFFADEMKAAGYEVIE